jgi:MYXO-CTERM domain-containing protein
MVKTIEKNGNNGGEYISEPRIAMVGKNVVATYGKSYLARDRNNNNNGHAEDGSKLVAAAMFDGATLNMIGTEQRGVGIFGRHSSSYVTQFGPKGEPALAVIGGSSTGTGKGFVSIIPIKADNTFGLKDAAKTYTAAPYADVANVQARGLRNPNNQARGFIEGRGMIENPGYVADANDPKNKTNFMPEVKYVSMSAITGYKDAVTAKEGKRNSAYLSLVPAVWREGLATAPGVPTPTPGTKPDGTPDEVGPAPRTNNPPTNTDPDKTSDGTVTNGQETNPGESGSGRRNPNMAASDGCSTSGSPVGSFGFIGLAIAGVLVALRRKREEA